MPRRKREHSEQVVLRKPRLLLVEINGNELERDRRHALQIQQGIQHRIAVGAAGKAHHDPIAVFDHAEVANGVAGLAANAFLQFIEAVLVHHTLRVRQSSDSHDKTGTRQGKGDAAIGLESRNVVSIRSTDIDRKSGPTEQPNAL